MTFLRQKLVKMDCKGLFSCLLTVAMGNNQGLSGRYFQLRDGSGSGIAKKLRVRVRVRIGYGYLHHIFDQSGIIGYSKS